MTEATPGPEPIVVSPEEERFLERFFRRQMLPWAFVLLVIPVTAAWWLADDDGGAREARTSAGLAQVRTENQKLRAELVALTGRVDAGLSSDHGADELDRRVADAKQSVRMIEARVTAALERRLDALEASVVHGAALPASGPAAPPPDAAAWDVSAILDRLYALEMRNGQSASEQRLAGIEQRVAHLESAWRTAPAAPASD